MCFNAIRSRWFRSCSSVNQRNRHLVMTFLILMRKRRVHYREMVLEEAFSLRIPFLSILLVGLSHALDYSNAGACSGKNCQHSA